MLFFSSKSRLHARFGELTAPVGIPLQILGTGCAATKSIKPEASDTGAYRPFLTS
jgi:hypothetical protein